MIAAVAAGTLAQLRLRNFPHKRIEYGPEAFTRCPTGNAIVMARDFSAGDRFFAPTGVSPQGRVNNNGRVLARRDIGGQCWVFAKAGVPHATIADHEYLTDQVVDGLQCALYRWAAEARQPVEITGGGIVPPEELPGVFERFPGLVYRFTFTVARGVPDSTFDGLGATIVELDAVNTGSEVATVNADGETGPSQEAR
jgi:hypothetical protein